ncbi:MAG: recombination regulator RecX [Chlorobium sp.]|nr:recombination regulator RecX [Chlorobium phaeovibrioides]NQU45597.1 recombination regulator RecX [Chlorobium sp.]
MRSEKTTEKKLPTPGETMTLAFKLLGLRNHSIAELERKLLTRGCPEESTAEVLRRLKERGVLDDRAFSEEFIRGRLKRRPAGTMKLRAELRKKGVPDNIAEEVLKSYNGMKGAMLAAEKKLTALMRFTPSVRKKKLEIFLRNRGFGWQEIQQATKRLQEEMSEYEPLGDDTEDYG